MIDKPESQHPLLYRRRGPDSARKLQHPTLRADLPTLPTLATCTSTCYLAYYLTNLVASHSRPRRLRQDKTGFLKFRKIHKAFPLRYRSPTLLLDLPKPYPFSSSHFAAVDSWGTGIRHPQACAFLGVRPVSVSAIISS